MGTVSKRPFAVVTGASSGIGLELARQFAAHGHDLLIVSDTASIHDAAASLRTDGCAVDAVQADLTTFDGCEAFARAIVEDGRPVDAIAINAGVGVGGRFHEIDLGEELSMIALNVDAVVHIAKRVVPPMIDRGGGRILITASIASTMPAPYMAVYAATKAFDLSFAEALRYELKDHGITVTALMPGPTDTNFFERADLEDTKVGQQKKDDPAKVAEQAYAALMRGDDAVIAGGVKTKAMGLAAEVLPEKVKAAAHARMTEPGSGRKS